MRDIRIQRVEEEEDGRISEKRRPVLRTEPWEIVRVDPRACAVQRYAGELICNTEWKSLSGGATVAAAVAEQGSDRSRLGLLSQALVQRTRR